MSSCIVQKKTIHDKVIEFIISADASYRDHSYPYSNHYLIKNLSEILFNSDYESDHNKWYGLKVESINNAAKVLCERSEAQLLKDKEVIELI